METMTDSEWRKYFEQPIPETRDKDSFVHRVINELPVKKQNQGRNITLVFFGLAALLLSVLFGFTLSDLILSIPEGIKNCYLPMLVIVASWGMAALLIQQVLQVLGDD